MLDRVLGHYQLSGPVGIDIGPGETPQGLHRDDVVYPLPWPHQQVVLNTMWALDDFTEDNGATLIVPGSHRSSPAEQPPDDDAVAATMPAGSRDVLRRHRVARRRRQPHRRAPARRHPRVRRGVAAGAGEPRHRGRRWTSMRTLDPRLQELLGYNIFPPFLGYVDGRHPRRTLMQEHDPLGRHVATSA